ncbi:glutamate racemase [Bifidobacterium xylocopae]|uniref:Glutamate racemase n=1 Tax=Bifidobacterium xylocopae TaxID=2493119 RepID=A0A366KCY6_9BIFI|nr:glutamate racemase [Bifidobacterium xylocopae]RBP99082.1 glutamate racemase [Bifidobacterium xylocopae]
MAGAAPIGIFDSGLGGLSVTAAVHRLLPAENLLFYGDSAYAPYGIKSPEQVRERCFTITDALVARGAKAIVVACNTATSVCVGDLRARYPIPIVGMEPALKPACDRDAGRPQRVIVAATPLTLKETKFARLLARFQADHTIWSQPCPDLVTILESGHLDDRDLVREALDRYLGPYDLSQVDSIVLGCTHFVFYRDYFREYCPPTVAVIDGNEGTARQLRKLLAGRGELGGGDPGSVSIGNSDPSPELAAYSRQLLERLS